ncbi:RNA polymerase sigma factor [Chitinophaga sp. sic0106]|uniref:RNA polymerase sigma factor n=1 Tax=Chitinophaga sp. sic0106 TaxID=2854785 RepID=UPI001C46D376|nr:sigma-70 family RNA polymerase sigma factor [Chitinophaga sp. sic0106]MBV7533024.1 sigma-70 family RNA polymerase sigma factor [Chitinophaga sp. sic0106]
MQPTNLHKDEIQSLVAQGNQAAFKQLFLRYRDFVYTTALRITQSEIEAEEIVQDVFVKIWSIREELADINNLEAFIFTIARNYTFNALKRILRERERTGEWPVKESLSAVEPDELAGAREFLHLYQQAIEKLPPQQKQVYLLIKEEELTKVEVARIMRISPNTVKSHYDAAVRAVRAFCTPYRKISCLLFMLL